MSDGTPSVPRSRWLLVHAVAVFAFLYLPIVVLILYSFNGEGVGGFPPHRLTFDWYRVLFADSPLWDSVLNSLQVAFAAMVISLMLFNMMGTKLGRMTIILGHGTALISVAATEVFAGLQKLDRAQEEASLDLGANYWQTFWRVTVPNLKLPIIGAALLIFTLSMDEIAVSFFLIGRDNTLPLEIWGRLRRGITPEINAVSTIIFVFSLAAIVAWYRLRIRAKGSAEVGAELFESAVPERL